MSRSDAKRFKIRLQGWADIGRRKMDTDRKLMFRLHAGYNFSDEDEIFTWVDLYPQDVHFIGRLVIGVSCCRKRMLIYVMIFAISV